MLQGWNFSLTAEDNPFSLWKPVGFCSTAERICLTVNHARRSTEILWPSQWFWLPFISGHWHCELHLRGGDYLKDKLSCIVPACNSSFIQRRFFSSCPQSTQSQQQDFRSRAAIRAGVGGVPAHVLKIHLCDLASMQFPHLHMHSLQKGL